MEQWMDGWMKIIIKLITALTNNLRSFTFLLPTENFKIFNHSLVVFLLSLNIRHTLLKDLNPPTVNSRPFADLSSQPP